MKLTVLVVKCNKNIFRERKKKKNGVLNGGQIHVCG